MVKTSIMIVEDEAVISMHIQNSLIKLGYDVCGCVNSGEEAVRMASELKPDLILMDIILQGRMDGIEAAKIIKDTLGVPVVYMTGNADFQTITKARETDPHGYVLKPINVLHLFSTIDTVLHRNKLETSLRESDEKLRRIIENSKDGIVLADENGLIIEWNNGMERNTGLLKSDVMGRQVWDVQYDLMDKNQNKSFTHESFRKIYGQMLSGVQGEFANKYIEGRIKHRDGSKLIVEDLVLQLPTIKGTMICIFQRNITERRLTEDALRESEERFRALVQNLQDFIFILNSEGIVMFENPSSAATLGYSLLGKRGFDVIHPDDFSIAMDAFDEVIEKKNKHIPTEFRIRSKDGSWIHVEALATNLFDDSIINGMLLVCRDITMRMNTQMTLQESEERFRALMDNLQDIVLILDSSGIIKFENPSAQTILGYSLLGKSVFELIHTDDMPAAKKDFREAMEKTNRPRPSLYHVRHQDGSWLYIEVLATNLFDNSIIQGMMVVGHNVTLRMQTQKALLESEQRYRALFDQSPVGVFLFDLDLVIKECNERFADIVHKRREQLIGFDAKNQKEQPVVLKMKATIDGNPSFWEGWYHLPDSEDVVFHSVYYNPLRDAEGHVIGGIAVINDLTDRKNAEEKLTVSEERNRLLVENANESIAVLQNRRFVFTNPQFIKLCGYPAQELGSRDFTEFIYPDDRSMIEERYRKRMGGDQTPFMYETRFINNEGVIKWTELNSVLFSWEGDTAILLFIRDITERKLAEEERRKMESQIQQTQKLESLGVLAGGIAHDFNNLLMAILGNIDLALLELTPSSPARGNLLEAAKASQRAADLCRQMLAYSGRGRFTSELLNLNEIIEDVGHMLEVSISKKAILRFNYASGLSSIEADATQVRQIIMNLVINASDAIGEKSGVISLSTGMMDCDRSYLSETWLNEKLPEGQYVYLEVADTGCGMDQKTLPKIFDPFFTTKFTGRGLGLAAVLGIVRGHKSAIKVYSEKGRGTTFKILFPAGEGIAEHANWTHVNGKEWRGSGTILLADDEETIRTLGRRMLERMGFSVLTATNGREVLDIFGDHADEITCIILDLTMPHMDGEEAYRELRRARKDVRVILSSGYNEQEITQRFAGKGLAGFIQKPYQTADLAAKLKEILG
jgi:PAS domain S-box-containing protein